MMKEENKIRHCLYSGEPFLPRRNNQIFASRKNRIAYHNDISNKLRNDLKLANKHLMTNYKICIEVLNGKKNVTVHREFLKGKGFDFRYITNLRDNSTKTAYAFAIYDASFEKIDENNYLITKL
ncbi:hypothetical protein [Flavobacterium sp.]|uniref:hypothetical protein n=1 Tax=Flavobacterium sp. TaxID=239 RepID=UPI00391D2901